MDIMLHKDALSKSLRKKLGILNATKKASAIASAPINLAITTSLINPANLEQVVIKETIEPDFSKFVDLAPRSSVSVLWRAS